MSLYNMLFGKNPHSEIILALLGLKECDVERYRDCGIADGEIYIYTRTGGGNREDYPNEKLTGNPYYKYDEDDDFDTTYATYYFRYPAEVKDQIPCLFDVVNKGLPASLIQWITKTLFREPTEDDKRVAINKKQVDVFNRLIRSGDLTEPWNGHTCVILSDDGAKAVFKMVEEDGKTYYGVSPLKFKLLENDYKYSCDKKKGGEGQSRVAIVAPRKWEIDRDAADRYLTLYGEQFPKAAAYFRERWDR